MPEEKMPITETVTPPPTPTPNPEPEEPHTARELELERALSELKTEMQALREQNQKLFITATGAQAQNEPTLEEQNIARMKDLIRNGFTPTY